MTLTPPSTPNLDRKAQARLMTFATYAAVAVAVSLMAIKFVAWLMTDSVSLLSTLVDSLLDIGASTVNLFAVRHALQPADEEHRFGHGKAESLAGLAQAAFISGSAVFLVLQAGERLYNPSPILNISVGYGVMVISIIATVSLVMFQKSVVKRTGSLAIAADSTHYSMDVLVNVSVLVSLYLASELGWVIADPLFAIVISFYIIYGAYAVGVEAYHVLMDRELSLEDRQKIHEIAESHDQVSNVHDLRTRHAGQDMFVQLHLEMSGDISLLKAHAIAEEVMENIQSEFPKAEVLIHQDPSGINEKRAFDD